MSWHCYCPTIQPPNLPDLGRGDAAVIIFAEDTECLLVAALHVKVFRSVLHDGTKSLTINHPELPRTIMSALTWKSILPLSLSILLIMSVTSTSVGLWPALLSQSWTKLFEFCWDIFKIDNHLAKIFQKSSTLVLMAAYGLWRLPAISLGEVSGHLPVKTCEGSWWADIMSLVCSTFRLWNVKINKCK